MNKFAIPAILLATVMVAGMFAFMPVEQASTVHLSGTITLAAGGIGVGDFADNSITADSIAADFATEIANAVDADVDFSIGSIDAGGIVAGSFAASSVTGTALAANGATEINDGIRNLSCSVITPGDHIGGADVASKVDHLDGISDITLNFVVIDELGDGVAGLLLVDFTFVVISPIASDAITIDQTFTDLGDGLYSIDYDVDSGDFGADGSEDSYVVGVTVDDIDESATPLTGTCASQMWTGVTTS